eukprot:TRINITY_DN13930_c0_g2_i1.p1 TRINITY_DN13930_c0_g2~~TRINITY_DN13930_c0_g2_i1.p1  ORF type:complete len:299 (+),score=41.64 TRINITY_DN13930_c0_g2_i1:31-897(+)
MGEEVRTLLWRKRLLRQAQFEWLIFRDVRVWPVIVLGLFMQWVHNAFHNLVYHLSQPSPPLDQSPIHDQGFKLIPDLSDHPQITTYLITILFVFFAFQLSTPFIWNSAIGSNRSSAIVMFWRACIVCSIALALRCLTFMVTILPAPALHCQVGQGEFHPPETVMQILFRVDVLNGCGDLTFSSHMTYGLLCFFCVWYYSESVAFKCVSGLLASALAILIIAQRDHYTLDVVVALYVVPLLWAVVHYRWPDSLILFDGDHGKTFHESLRSNAKWNDDEVLLLSDGEHGA